MEILIAVIELLAPQLLCNKGWMDDQAWRLACLEQVDLALWSGLINGKERRVVARLLV